jgi:hypothetical protein
MWELYVAAVELWERLLLSQAVHPVIHPACSPSSPSPSPPSPSLWAWETSISLKPFYSGWGKQYGSNSWLTATGRPWRPIWAQLTFNVLHPEKSASFYNVHFLVWIMLQSEVAIATWISKGVTWKALRKSLKRWFSKTPLSISAGRALL